MPTLVVGMAIEYAGSLTLAFAISIAALRAWGYTQDAGLTHLLGAEA
jgi:hypothetical protein